jgi:hypothetical protein
MNLGNKSYDLDFREKRRQDFARDRRGSNATNGFARAGTPATLPVANSVFGMVGKVRVGRTERFAHCFISLRPRVFVSNENRYRGAESFSFENTGQNFTPIRFLSLSGDSALARTAAIEFPLNVIVRQINPWRTTVDNDSDSAAMRFAEGGNAKKLAKAVAHLRVV